MRRVQFAGAAVAAVALCALLTACSSQPGDTVPARVPEPTRSASTNPTPEPDPDPTLLPGGTALANRAYFDFVNSRLLAVNPNPSSDAIVENLQSAGFAKSDLEVTPDSTAVIGRPADSIQFAVRTSQGCLLGQFQAGDYTSMVGPTLGGGFCLIGETETVP